MGANSHSWQTYGSNPCFIQIFDGPRIKSLESYPAARLWVQFGRVMGFVTVAREVQAHRDAGIRFHEERAEHALQGSRPSPLIAGYLLVGAGILLLLVFLVRGGH
jgi:hypothetical protein